MRLLILADTHVPRRARDLPSVVWDAATRSDLVLHAGDWVDVALLDALEQCAPVLGVWGNNDGSDLRARLPEVSVADVDGLRVTVVHDTGASAGRERRVDSRFAGSDVVVFGHSHIPWDSTTASGIRLLNPGSPTDRRRQPAATYLTAVVADARLRDVELRAV